MQSESKMSMLTETMEKMAGAPGEAMGFRSPGEKTKIRSATIGER